MRGNRYQREEKIVIWKSKQNLRDITQETLPNLRIYETLPNQNKCIIYITRGCALWNHVKNTNESKYEDKNVKLPYLIISA